MVHPGMPESKIPSGPLFGLPDVAMWLFPTQVQATVSPSGMLTALGTKLVPPCPTLTFVVAAVAPRGTKARKNADNPADIRARQLDRIFGRTLAAGRRRH